MILGIPEILLIIIAVVLIGGIWYLWSKIKNLDETKTSVKAQIDESYERLNELKNEIEIHENDCRTIEFALDKIELQFKHSNELLRETDKQIAEGKQRIGEYEKYTQQLKEQRTLLIEQMNKELEDERLAAWAEQDEAYNNLTERNIEVLHEIETNTDKLNDLKSKQLAYIRERARQEELKANQDFYRLVLDNSAENDIKLLRQVQNVISKKDAIDKILWSLYYKPAYDVLVSHLFKTAKPCGIYKITSLASGKVYIGQSVDCATRFSDHIKAGLAYVPTSNKLYQAMHKEGVENFLFELLEEVPREKLNEREVYWIEFYDTKNSGLNVTKGGS